MDIEIREVAGKGRGVFARRDFKRGELVEAAPVIVIPDEEVDLIEKTALADYYYKWGNSHFALVLGYGSLYNFSATPNLSFKPDLESKVMLYRARKSIRKEQELTINYLCDLWFRPIDHPIHSEIRIE
jgi:SET domain-containing protein